MFSTFTKGDGQRVLLIRADRIVRIEDNTHSGCTLAWEEGGQQILCTIDGTAAENYARLQQEELAAIAEAQRIDQRRANNLPILPVARGRP